MFCDIQGSSLWADTSAGTSNLQSCIYEGLPLHKNVRRPTVHLDESKEIAYGSVLCPAWFSCRVFDMARKRFPGYRSLRWRHNGRDGVSNHQPPDCLLNRLFRRRSKKTSKLRVTGLCEGNSPGIGEFPAQMASNAEDVSIWWRHHGFSTTSSP